MICQNCECEHDGSYGSGRFCSLKCARGFSTKAKRKEINKSISGRMIGKGNPDVTLICNNCEKPFTVHWNKRKQKTCSRKCARKIFWTEDKRESFGKIISLRNGEGKAGFSFGNKKSIFEFKNIKVRCDSNIERLGIVAIIKEYKIKDIRRCDFSIKYQYNNKNHYFNPDFLIEKEDGGIIILECKSTISKNSTLKETRPFYFLTVEEKKRALKAYCELTQKIPIWFDSGKLQKL